MNEDEEFLFSIISKRSKKLANTFSTNAEGITINTEISEKLKNLPYFLSFYVTYALLSAVRQTAKVINEENSEVEIDAIYSNYFLKYIQSHPVIEDKKIIYNILNINESINYIRKISTEELEKIKKFFKYYREFYIRSNENDNDKLSFLLWFSENDKFITDSINTYDKNDERCSLAFIIPFSFNFFLPYEEVQKELNEFSENVKFFSRSVNSLIGSKFSNDYYPDISNYINFSYHSGSKESIYDIFDRYLYVYDNMNKDLLTEKASTGLLSLGKNVQKKFSMRITHSSSELRDNTRTDYFLAVELIESARTGRFPARH